MDSFDRTVRGHSACHLMAGFICGYDPICAPRAPLIYKVLLSLVGDESCLRLTWDRDTYIFKMSLGAIESEYLLERALPSEAVRLQLFNRVVDFAKRVASLRRGDDYSYNIQKHANGLIRPEMDETEYLMSGANGPVLMESIAHLEAGRTVEMPQVLDVCCGSKMFYPDKNDLMVTFSDIRQESEVLCDGRKLTIDPDIVQDFRKLGYRDQSFDMVVFDPPHLVRAGEKSWMAKKYGVLNKTTWYEDLRKGFSEAFRVLRDKGVLIFKWNETQIATSRILKLSPYKPLLIQRTGKGDKTHWIVFIKTSFKKVPDGE